MPLSEAQRSPALSSASRPSNSGTSHHPPSSSTIPSPPSASSTSATTLTLETVLQSYPDPLTALEAIIQERNNFSSQNHQLWKLIEKQRAMYTAANRELEKLRLAANIPLTTGAGTSSGSNSKQMNGSNNASFSKKPERPERAEERRGKLSRASSEEHHPGNSAATFEIPPNSSLDSTPRLNGAPYATSSPSVSSSVPEDAPSQPQPQRPARGESLPTTTPAPVSSSSTSRMGPLNLQKKSSAPATSSSSSSNATSTPSATPQLLPPINSTPEIKETSPSLPQIVTQPAGSILNAQSSRSSGGLGVDLLAPHIDKRSARGSRISLPDEAARYIATMGDSPMASPGISEFGASTGRPDTSGEGDMTIRAGGDAQRSVKKIDQDEDEDSDNESERSTPGASPLEAEVLYPVPETGGNGIGSREKRPPPINAPLHSRSGASGKSASIDSMDQSTPMQGTYSLQEHHTQAPTRPPPNVPVEQAPVPSQPIQRPPFYSHASGSGTSRTHDGDHGSNRDAAFYDQGQVLPRAPNGYTLPQSYSQRTESHSEQRANRHGHNQTHSPPQLYPSDLPSLRVKINGSNIKTNERGKDVLSFLIGVQAYRSSSHGPDEWKIEKMYSDVLALDGKVRSALGRSQSKKLPALPDAKLFRDNAPAKVDQRRAFLEQYLQALLHAPLKEMSDLCSFFSTDVSRDDRAPLASQGYKEGYLTKRGKNFGGWKTRYFVLQNSVLEYFENRGGAHLGSININGAQIGRQQKQATLDDDNAYRHAFLIIEQSKKGAAPARHVLCAASDAERDEWVDVLVRSVTPSLYAASSGYPSSASSGPRTSYTDDGYTQSDSTINPSRPSTSSSTPSEKILSGSSPVDRYDRGQGNQGWTDAQLAQRMIERTAYGQAPNQAGGSPGSMALSSSLPSNLDNPPPSIYGQTRSNSSLGSYVDLKDPRTAPQADSRSHPPQHMHDQTPGRKDRSGRTSYHPSLVLKQSADRGDDSSAGESTAAGSVLGGGVKKISGPLNAQPIPAGANFGKKEMDSPSNTDRDRKAKSGRFWPTFGKGGNNTGSGSERHGSNTSSPASAYPHANTAPGRAVFGVPLEQALTVAQIANLPAIIFRCIEYLEAKKAAEEEGIYRLSGSSAVIKSLKDRFNHEGDVNLLKHDEYWDPHAIAGLLKQFLRDLPTSILTRDLQQRFLSVVDLMDYNERINELTHLISQLPVANYCLLRAMTAHLILIVQNAALNKMTMRNVGIVFSPTLGIPAGILSLMLSEFDQVFSVDATDEASDAASNNDHDSLTTAQTERTPQKPRSSKPSARRPSNNSGYERVDKRNSMLYANTDTDKMLGLAGRKLEATEDSDDDDGVVTVPEESDFDTDHEDASSRQATSEQTGSGTPPSPNPQISVSYPVAESDQAASSQQQVNMHGAKAVAATRGLQINVVGKSQQRSSGLPTSPRPVRYPGSPGTSSSGHI